MISRTSIGIGVLVFGAGLVSGMFAQRVMAPTPEPSTVAAVSLPDVQHASLKQPVSARRAEPETEVWQETISWDDAVEPQQTYSEPATADERPNREERRRMWDQTSVTNREQWEANREAWAERRRVEGEIRKAAIRSNFVEHAKLSDAQAVRFDVLVAAMNMRLNEQAKIWREAADSGAISRSEARARMMKEFGTALSLTYDELDRNMPADWRASTSDDGFNLWSFVDTDIWRSMRGGPRGMRGQGQGQAQGGAPGQSGGWQQQHGH